MKTIFSITIILFLGISAVSAQNIFDRIDNAVSKVDRAANSAERAGDTGGKVLNLLGKKNTNKATSQSSTVSVLVTGGSYNSLNTLTVKVKSLPDVKNAALNYNSANSEITVETSQNAGELLNALLKSGAIKDENITGATDSTVSVSF